MNATKPYYGDIKVPGDNQEPIEHPSGVEIRPYLMARCADLLGMDLTQAVWRCGFRQGSESAAAYGISMPEGKEFIWVLADRHSGEIRKTWQGWAVELPAEFTRVLNYEPTEWRVPV